MTEWDEGDQGDGAPEAGLGGAAPDGLQSARPAQRPNLALGKATLFATWLIPVLEGFPRSQRFLLGDRLQGNTLDIIEGLVEAGYQKQPQDTLRRVNVLLEKQRVLFRLAYNLRLLDGRRYELAARKLDEIGEKVACIIDGSNEQVRCDGLFTGDDLLIPLERSRGLPLGNLTRQMLGNFFLDRFDHFVKARPWPLCPQPWAA
ncbi:hypothetical protein [Zoogloea sp.]|uniref:hypothetical protein n=1 Tax=Zoogloea sp. TaxID=49181 RepID=UPI001D2272FA|nr:hypothetical protein [Zoogloea sp.]MBK6652557.1 hypothetical protein [Zoogloea sp.]